MLCRKIPQRRGGEETVPFANVWHCSRRACERREWKRVRTKWLRSSGSCHVLAAKPVRHAGLTQMWNQARLTDGEVTSFGRELLS
jgi:hypothetical protein